MASKSASSLMTLYLTLASSCLGKTADMSAFNNPSHGPPASDFAAADSLPTSVLRAAAAAASVVPKDATYPFSLGNSETSTIHSDWVSFKEGAALSWVADMDVDCDGVNHKCEGNRDGQSQTNWGTLSAYAVPYIVIPDRFLAANKDILPGNNLAAVICNGKMYYGILGDSNGDDPQITGEASWLMARTCFPKEDLQGNNAHSSKDVTYILFTGKDAVLPDNAMDKTYITDFDTLRSMGDKLVRALASNMDKSASSESPATSLWAGRGGPVMMIVVLFCAVLVTLACQGDAILMDHSEAVSAGPCWKAMAAWYGDTSDYGYLSLHFSPGQVIEGDACYKDESYLEDLLYAGGH